MTGLPLFDHARARGASQAARCADNAERLGWDLVGARDWIVGRLAEGDASGEELVLGAKAAGFTPHDDRAFGAIFGGLARRGIIRKVGTVPRRRGHGTSGGIVWGLV